MKKTTDRSVLAGAMSIAAMLLARSAHATSGIGNQPQSFVPESPSLALIAPTLIVISGYLIYRTIRHRRARGRSTG